MHLNLITTKRCNLSCTHCIFSCPIDEEIDIDMFEDFVERLLPYDLRSVCFTGGEPIMHSDLYKLVYLTTKHHLRISFVSNGWAYKDYLPILSDFTEYIDSIHLSLDGMQETHDRLRRDESFSRVGEAVKVFQEKGMEITINFILNSRNLDEMEDVFIHCQKLGVRGIKVGGMLPTTKNGKWLLSPEQRKASFEKIQKIKGDFDTHIQCANSLYNPEKLSFCPVVSGYSITLDSSGDILYCCDIVSPNTIIGLAGDEVISLLKRKGTLSQRILEKRLSKIHNDRLSVKDQSCMFCYDLFQNNYSSVLPVVSPVVAPPLVLPPSPEPPSLSELPPPPRSICGM